MDPQSLLFFLSLRQPRRIRVIENVLSGHKTVSNLYWGMRYGLLHDLGALRSVDKRLDKQSIGDLVEAGDVTIHDHRDLLLTPKGYQRVIHLRKHWYVPKFLKYNLKYNVKRFKARFLLAIQVASEYSYRNRKYYPVQIDYRDAMLVKRWFYYFRDQNLVGRCHHFLVAVCKRLDQLNPTLGWQASNLLVGHEDPGQTLYQQGRRLHQPITEMLFRQLDILCVLLVMINQSHNLFTPLLAGLKISPISDSALLTFRLACSHYGFKQISKIQSIRLSTVKEHLLGTAIFVKGGSFPYQDFLTPSLLHQLNQLYHGNPDRWDYTKCKPLDFFYFRLFQILRSKQHE